MDRSRIDVDQPHAVAFWAREWGVSPEKLRDSVRRVGTITVDVKRDLDR